MNMGTSYYSISHHHLADHLIYLSLSSSFWFGAGWLLHCLPSHSPLVVSSQPPLVLLSCQLVFESPIVARPSRPLVTPPSRLLAASAGCRIASRRPFVAPPSRRLIVPDGCCVDSRRAAVSSTVPHSRPSNAPPHRRHCTPSSPSTAATTATAAATCVFERFTLVH